MLIRWVERNPLTADCRRRDRAKGGAACHERLNFRALLIAHGEVEEVAVKRVAKVLPWARSRELGLEQVGQLDKF